MDDDSPLPPPIIEKPTADCGGRAILRRRRRQTIDAIDEGTNERPKVVCWTDGHGYMVIILEAQGRLEREKLDRTSAAEEEEEDNELAQPCGRNKETAFDREKH